MSAWDFENADRKRKQAPTEPMAEAAKAADARTEWRRTNRCRWTTWFRRRARSAGRRHRQGVVAAITEEGVLVDGR